MKAIYGEQKGIARILRWLGAKLVSVQRIEPDLTLVRLYRAGKKGNAKKFFFFDFPILIRGLTLKYS